MPSVAPERFILIFSIVISTFGLVSTVVIVLVSPTVIIENFLLRKPLIGSIFALICLCGMIAVLFPRKCSEICDSQKKSELMTPHVKNVNSCAAVQGHHPDCGEFSCHVLNLGRHSLCAACTGLFVGAIMALVGTVFYFFTNWNVGEHALFTVFFGVTGIAIGFLQLRFKGIIRLALNTCFVFGAFLAIMGMDRSIGSVLLDMFLVALILFWISTRILLSQWDHRRICRRCARNLRNTRRRKSASMSSPHSRKSGNYQKNAEEHDYGWPNQRPLITYKPPHASQDYHYAEE